MPQQKEMKYRDALSSYNEGMSSIFALERSPFTDNDSEEIAALRYALETLYCTLVVEDFTIRKADGTLLSLKEIEQGADATD